MALRVKRTKTKTKTKYYDERYYDNNNILNYLITHRNEEDLLLNWSQNKMFLCLLDRNNFNPLKIGERETEPNRESSEGDIFNEKMWEKEDIKINGILATRPELIVWALSYLCSAQVEIYLGPKTSGKSHTRFNVQGTRDFWIDIFGFSRKGKGENISCLSFLRETGIIDWLIKLFPKRDYYKNCFTDRLDILPGFKDVIDRYLALRKIKMDEYQKEDLINRGRLKIPPRGFFVNHADSIRFLNNDNFAAKILSENLNSDFLDTDIQYARKIISKKQNKVKIDSYCATIIVFPNKGIIAFDIMPFLPSTTDTTKSRILPTANEYDQICRKTGSLPVDISYYKISLGLEESQDIQEAYRYKVATSSNGKKLFIQEGKAFDESQKAYNRVYKQNDASVILEKFNSFEINVEHFVAYPILFNNSFPVNHPAFLFLMTTKNHQKFSPTATPAEKTKIFIELGIWTYEEARIQLEIMLEKALSIEKNSESSVVSDLLKDAITVEVEGRVFQLKRKRN